MDNGNYENKSLAHNAHSVGASEYHLQWCTKYRYETLEKESHWRDCEDAVRGAAQRHGMQILELGVMSDHVHVVAVLPPDMSPCRAVALLRGSSAYELFRKHPNFRKMYRSGHFWSRGYFYRSVSDITEGEVREYVCEDNSPRQRPLVAY